MRTGGSGWTWLSVATIRELHHELDEKKYVGLLAEMRPGGYRPFAIRDSGGVVGAQVITNLYYERHVYDLVTKASTRSKGYGQALLAHVEDVARREGCKYIVLACGREREAALRFYERLGFERPGYSMRKAQGCRNPGSGTEPVAARESARPAPVRLAWG